MAKNLPKSVLHFRSFWFAYKPQGSYSLEFLSSNFPDMEKVWKTEIKSGKMGKSLEFFQSCNNLALFVIIFFRFGEILLNLAHTLVFLHSVFKVSIDHLFNNLESGKETIVLEKVWKKS